MDDIFFMSHALIQADKARILNEIPVGCVITLGNEIIARGYNQRNTMKNSLFHAEITAINEACRFVNDWRLEGCTLYVTIEPCPMCAGAIIQSRISRVVFGARNKKAGCCGSILNVTGEKAFNHQTEVREGVLIDECASLMKSFFYNIRNIRN